MAEGRTAFALADDDWYVEPESSTTFLLARESFPGRIYDPCAGQGNVVRTCLTHGLDAVGTDLRTRPGAAGAAWFLGERDFLAPGRFPVARSIIMNPPYGKAVLAEAFIRRALTMPCVRKVAVFVTDKFIFGAGRAKGLHHDHPPSRVYPIWPRPSCPPGEFLLGGGKATGGVGNFIWLVYDRDHQGPSQIIW